MISCSNDDDSPTGPVEGFDIVGSWALTKLEGAPGSVSAENSTWVFNSDGTYTWFLKYAPYFDETDNGNYSINDNILTLSGGIPMIVAGETDALTLTIESVSTFSFKDDEGDKWTYEKIE